MGRGGRRGFLPIGMLWDISWHETIGRDTFWTPAHIVIQLGGIIPAFLFAWLTLKTTFRGTDDERVVREGVALFAQGAGFHLVIRPVECFADAVDEFGDGDWRGGMDGAGEGIAPPS